MGSWWHRDVIAAGKLPLGLCFLAFVVTFASTRTITRLIRDGRGPFRNQVTASGTHIHHAVPGLILLIIGALTAVGGPGSLGWLCFAGVCVGIGMSLVLDEFALILHLQDVYWNGEGQLSVEAVTLTAACLGLMLVGFSPFGIRGASGIERSIRLSASALLVIDGVFSVVCALKGKYRCALFGLFLPPVAWTGAVRLARPASIWARHRYHGERMERATARAAAFDRRWKPVQTDWEDFVGGRPSLAGPGQPAAQGGRAAEGLAATLAAWRLASPGPGQRQGSGKVVHGLVYRAVPADQFERQPPAPRIVQQRHDDPGDIRAGDAAPGDRRDREPDPVGGRGVGEPAGTQDGPVQVPGAQVVLGGGLRGDVGGPDLITVAAGRLAGSIEETCTNRRTPARSAASAISTEAPRSTASLRGTPLPGPAPAAKTTASAPDSKAAASPAEAASRSHTTASAPACCTSAAWAGFLISPTAWSPRPVRSRSSRSAIFPCPPAITTRMPPPYRGRIVSPLLNGRRHGQGWTRRVTLP